MIRRFKVKGKRGRMEVTILPQADGKFKAVMSDETGGLLNCDHSLETDTEIECITRAKAFCQYILARFKPSY